jgi:outer membrane assembly lipoprotein YfiO
MLRFVLVVTAFLVLAPALAVHAQWTYTPEIGRFINLKNMPRETPELQIEYARSLMLDGDYSAALNETDKFDEFYSDSDLVDQNQFLKGEIRLGRKQYKKAAQEFQLVITDHPSSPLYDDVTKKQYEIGDALYEKGVKRYAERDDSYWNRIIFFLDFTASRPFKQAVDVYEMVTDNQPFTPEAAEAQFKIGKCYEARGLYAEAADEYQRVLEDYPDSPWVREAAYGLTQSYKETVHDPEYDQGPSLSAIRSVREFAARFPEDERNDELREMESQMWERVAEQRYQTAQFYQRRREMVAARAYYVIVATEHPDTKAGQKAGEWLSKNPLKDTLQSKFLNSLIASSNE